MSEKITNLKTIADDNVFPNVKDANVPDTIMRVADLSKYINLLVSIKINGDIDSTTITSDIATFTTADIGTLNVSGASQFEGEATFGGNARVDGNIIVNGVDNITDKDGNAILKNESLDDFKTKFFSDYGFHRFSNVVISNYYEGGVNTKFDSQLTSIEAMFTHAKVLSISEGVLDYLNLPDYPSVANMNAAFDSTECKGIRCGQIGGDKGVSAVLAFFYCTAESITINQGKSVKISNANSMFFRCANLVEVGGFDMSLASNIQGAFTECPKLKHIHCTHFKVSFDISASTAFEQSDLVEIISNLDQVTTPQTLTMGATNLAKLTQEQILVATGKGWTLA